MGGGDVDVQGITWFELFKGNSQDLEVVLGTVPHSSHLSQHLLSVKWLGPPSPTGSARLFSGPLCTGHQQRTQSSVQSTVLLFSNLAEGGSSLPHSGSSWVFIIIMFSDIWARSPPHPFPNQVQKHLFAWSPLFRFFKAAWAGRGCGETLRILRFTYFSQQSQTSLG